MLRAAGLQRVLAVTTKVRRRRQEPVASVGVKLSATEFISVVERLLRYLEAGTFGVVQKPSSHWGKPSGGRATTSQGGIRMAGPLLMDTAENIQIACQLNWSLSVFSGTTLRSRTIGCPHRAWRHAARQCLTVGRMRHKPDAARCRVGFVCGSAWPSTPASLLHDDRGLFD